MCLLKLPHNFQKFLSAEIVPCLSRLFEELLLSHCLSRDSRVVGSREEECFVPIHALIPNECILDSNSECMPDVEVACNVGRGEGDGEPLGIGSLVVGVEEFA